MKPWSTSTLENKRATYRISANSFDFSCLGERKSLAGGVKTSLTLLQLFREHAPQACL